MPVERFGRDVENVFLKVFERLYPKYFFAAFGVTDDEIAEPEIVDDCFSEVYREFL